MLAETDHVDLERRLRIRRRNLDRLKQEANYIAEDETPPAVLDRIQAQIRVEQEEVRFLERQLGERDGHRRPGLGRGLFELSPRLGPLASALLVVAVGGLLLVVVVTLIPRAFRRTTSFGVESTNTPLPTQTPVSPALVSTATLVPVPTATSAPTPELPTSTPTPAVPLGTVNVDVLNLRGGPDTTFGLRAKLMQGEKLNLLGRNDETTWLAVSTVDGATGWVAAEYVSMTVMIDELLVKKVEE